VNGKAANWQNPGVNASSPLFLWFGGLFKNPIGISSFRPALADRIGLRRVSAPMENNPERNLCKIPVAALCVRRTILKVQ